MTLNNIKTLKSERGFTIVELLIVIVVIAILAAISIVAYNGVQNSARATQYAADASGIVKAAEAYNARESSTGYPTVAELTSAVAPTSTVVLPSNIALTKWTGAANPTATEATVTVNASGARVYQVKECSATTGLIVFYNDPRDNTLKQARAGSGTC